MTKVSSRKFRLAGVIKVVRTIHVGGMSVWYNVARGDKIPICPGVAFERHSRGEVQATPITGTTGILPVGGRRGIPPFQRAGRPLSQSRRRAFHRTSPDSVRLQGMVIQFGGISTTIRNARA